MDTDQAQRVFPDAHVAELADAAVAGDRGRVTALVKGGADPNAHGEHGVTPLEWSLLHKSEEGLTLLLDAGARAAEPGVGGATVMHMAAMASDPIYLKTLLDHGASPDAPHGSTGASPLAAALMNPSRDAFDLLLAHHADANHSDHAGNTSLHVAAQAHKTWAVLALLQAGADPALRNRHGDTFQAYFAIQPAGGLNERARAERGELVAWLVAHQVPVEASLRP